MEGLKVGSKVRSLKDLGDTKLKGEIGVVREIRRQASWPVFVQFNADIFEQEIPMHFTEFELVKED